MDEREERRQLLQERALRLVEKALKKVKKRLALHRGELEEAEKHEEREHLVHLVQAHYSLLRRGMDQIVLKDWDPPGKEVVIPLDPRRSPQEIVAQLFKEVRRLKRRLPFCHKWIARFEEQEKRLEGLRKGILGAETEEALQVLLREETLFAEPGTELGTELGKEKKREAKEGGSFRRFETESGLQIFVGRSDRENDRLTFSFAHGNDFWFHASNFPGSHVVLRVEKGKEVDEGAFKDAMELALHFSKAKKERKEEVVFTECKHVNKPKGAPFGKVVLSKVKTKLVQRDEGRLNRLLRRGSYGSVLRL